MAKSILIAADVVPTSTNFDLFEKEKMLELVGEKLLREFSCAELIAMNLETPLCDKASPILKSGPNLIAPIRTISGIKKINPYFYTLANNHIMDQGSEGLDSTISILRKNEISFAGAGRNLSEARKPFVAKIWNKQIGFYCCAEHEFSIAGVDAPGANPFDPLESFDHVADLRKSCDYVVVLYHGGKEHYQYPSPMLQRVCRKFVEKGASLVVCQHSHCIGCEEKYDGGTIVYGQGNFLFESCKGPLVQTSLLIKLKEDFSLDFLPLVKVNNGVCLAEGECSEKILSAFHERGKQIKKEGFVENQYNKFAQKMLKEYMLTCFGYNHKLFCRFVNKLSGYRLSNFFTNSYKRSELLAIRNFIECEAHRELWIEGLK